MKYEKLHPYMILVNLKELQGFLAVPILNQILWSIFGKYGINKNPFLLNISLIVVIISYAFIKYFSFGLKYDLYYMNLCKGIINKTELKLPYCNISFMISERNIIQLIFKARRLEIYSAVNNNIAMDKIYMRDISLLKILNSSKYDMSNNIVHRSKLFGTFITIMSWSNFITVSLVIVPIIRQTTKILGEEISNRIYSKIDMEKYFIAVGIPPMIAKMAYLVILIILLFIILQTIRYGNFKLISCKNFFYTKSGIIYRNEQWIKKTSINAISESQMLVTKILGLSSLYFHCVGKKRKKSERNLLALSCSNRDIQKILRSVGYKCDYNNKLVPPKRCLKNFINIPLWCLFISLALVIIFLNYKSTRIIGLIFVGISLYLFYWLIFKILSYKNTSVSMNGRNLKVKGYKRLSFITGYVNLENIVNLCIRRNTFQLMSSRCDLVVYFESSNGESFRARNLDYKDTLKFVDELKEYYIK